MKIEIEEGERQMILLALAELALERPGWDLVIGNIAEKFHGREMLAEFKRSSADGIRQTKLRAGIVAKLRRVPAQYGAGGHTHRQRMLEGLAKEIEAENSALADSQEK